MKWFANNDDDDIKCPEDGNILRHIYIPHTYVAGMFMLSKVNISLQWLCWKEEVSRWQGITLIQRVMSKIRLEVCRLVARSCPTLCDHMDCSPPGSSVHGISQATIPEWVATSYSRGSSWPRSQTYVSYTGRQILYRWATWEVPFGG